MTTRDEDILDFDFFGEEEPPSWDETTERPPGPPRERPPRGPRRRMPRAPGNLTPLLRLVALIALAILIVVLLVVWVEGCATDRKRERYTDYMTEVGGVGNRSAQLGQDLATLLTTPALKLEDLDAKLGGYVQSAENQVAQAEEIDAPGALHNAHEGAIEALTFRANGLQGLKTAFQETADATEASVAGEQLALQMDRLLASDVIWTDSFKARAESVISTEEVVALEPPSSEFVTADELATPESLAAIWQRVQGAADGGTAPGLHGSGISYVKVLPSEDLLSTDTATEILVTDRLSFEVGVEDTGDFQEVSVVVTLTIPRDTPGPIVKKKTIPLIDPGETEAVTFNIGNDIPDFGEELSVKVDVDPVPGETNTANNTFEYPVIFSL